MSRGNGRTEPEQLDVEHELPASEDTSEEKPVAQVAAAEGELGKLRAERDMLVDRLARLQAEFENARKRAVRARFHQRPTRVMTICIISTRFGYPRMSPTWQRK